MMKKQKKVLAIYLNPKLHDRITKLAKYKHRSLSGQVGYMLTQYLQDMNSMGSITISSDGTTNGDTPNNTKDVDFDSPAYI